jgi:hypothetical protein
LELGREEGGNTESTREKAMRQKERTTDCSSKLRSISKPYRFVCAIIYNYSSYGAKLVKTFGILNELGEQQQQAISQADLSP